MARLARVVIPDLPHHVTQRGNRREGVSFGDDDYRLYLRLIGEAARASDTAVWVCCLMPNQVHFILVPADADGLRFPRRGPPLGARLTSYLTRTRGPRGSAVVARSNDF